MAESSRLQSGSGTIPDLPRIAVSADGRVSAQHMTYVIDAVRSLIAVLNGRLSFGDGRNSSQAGNIDGQLKTVTFTNANTDYEVPHGLGRVPLGIITLLVNADATVVRGSNHGSWTRERLFVRSNVAGSTAIFVVV